MATWDDADTSEADSESDDERANIDLMENVSEDSEASGLRIRYRRGIP